METAISYKDLITQAMNEIGKYPKTVFLGEGVITAERIYDTLKDIPSEQCIEFPIAENLIMGCAMGLTFRDYFPVVIFQRMDFMLCAADAIINHLCKVPKMSAGQYKFPLMIRAIIGSKQKEFDVGIQHNQDYTHIFSPYIDTYEIKEGINPYDLYTSVFEKHKENKTPALVIEYKDLY